MTLFPLVVEQSVAQGAAEIAFERRELFG